MFRNKSELLNQRGNVTRAVLNDLIVSLGTNGGRDLITSAALLLACRLQLQNQNIDETPFISIFNKFLRNPKDNKSFRTLSKMVHPNNFEHDRFSLGVNFLRSLDLETRDGRENHQFILDLYNNPYYEQALISLAREEIVSNSEKVSERKVVEAEEAERINFLRKQQREKIAQEDANRNLTDEDKQQRGQEFKAAQELAKLEKESELRKRAEQRRLAKEQAERERQRAENEQAAQRQRAERLARELLAREQAIRDRTAREQAEKNRLETLRLVAIATPAFLNACAAGNLEAARTAINQGANINITEPAANYSALQLAIMNGHTEMVRFLVGLDGLNFAHRNTLGLSALQIATANNKKDIVHLLCTAAINQRLFQATRSCHMFNFQEAIRMGADINSFDVNFNSNSVLQIAISCYRDQSHLNNSWVYRSFMNTDTLAPIRYLLGLNHLNISHRNHNGQTALQQAVTQNNEVIVRLIIALPVNIALLNNAAGGNLAGVEQALKDGADINCFEGAAKCTGLQLAIMNGHSHVAGFLARQNTIDLKHKNTPLNAPQKTALQIAIDCKNHTMVELISSLAVNQKLLNAAGGGNLELLRAALAEGADINAVIGNGVCNAIQLAIQNSKSTEIVRLMITEGADLEYKNSQGLNALDIASGCLNNNPSNNEFMEIKRQVNYAVTTKREVAERAAAQQYPSSTGYYSSSYRSSYYNW